MGLTESEIEARLAALRRRRETLDREIADLVLYLELGRRLGGTRTEEAFDAGPSTGEASAADSMARPSILKPPPPPAPTAKILPEPAAPVPAPTDPAAGIPPAIPFTQDPAGARRYGRALVEAACAAIAEAGHPLHAAEILERLGAQGFTLPGHDPVAALNTRLWKRSGPGGPVRRVAEATYALAREPDAG